MRAPRFGVPSRRAPWVKVCGLRSFADIELCARAGATHAGFNTWPGSPRCAEPGRVRALVEATRRVGLVPVILLVPGSALAGREALALGAWIQCATPLHRSLAGPCPGVVEARPALPERVESLTWGDALLLDAHAAGRPGGTGMRVPEELVRRAPHPFVLAGGLGPETVAGAVASLAPEGVDAASGLESAPGVKDPGRVRAFCQAALEAFGSIA